MYCTRLRCIARGLASGTAGASAVNVKVCWDAGVGWDGARRGGSGLVVGCAAGVGVCSSRALATGCSLLLLTLLLPPLPCVAPLLDALILPCSGRRGGSMRGKHSLMPGNKCSFLYKKPMIFVNASKALLRPAAYSRPIACTNLSQRCIQHMAHNTRMCVAQTTKLLTTAAACLPACLLCKCCG